MASGPDATTSTWLASALSGSARISRAAALSSTTSTRSVAQLLRDDSARACGDADSEPDGEEEGAADARLAFEPDRARPSAPPAAGEMVSPSPVPPCLRVVDMSACVNGWNSFADCSGVMPMPVSRTENLSCTFSPVRSSSSMFSRISPCSVNFTALLTRLVRIWPRRSGSPQQVLGNRRARHARGTPGPCRAPSGR